MAKRQREAQRGRSANESADEALLASYEDVADGESAAEAGAAKTIAQVKDTYASGGNEDVTE